MTNEEAIHILEQYREKPTLINEIETVEEAVWLDEALEMAIKTLETIPKYKDAYGKGWDDGAKASYEHLKMCEEEQDPCEVEAGKLQQAYNKGFEDCRQAVIDTIDKWVKNMGVLITLPANEVTPLFDSIHKLSSVNPEEPSITWVTGSDGAKIAFKDVPAWKVIKICQILESEG